MNCPTNKNAGTAMSGCGSEVNTHQSAWGGKNQVPAIAIKCWSTV